MKTFFSAGVLTAIGLFFSVPLCSAAIYYGNDYGNPLGGAVSGGTLTVTESGNNVTLRFTRGAGTFNEALVIYFDTVPGAGSSGTAGFADTANLETRCISGLGTAGRSTVNFASGFSADYALVLGVYSPLHSLYQLNEGGDGSMTLVRNLSISPFSDNPSAAYFETTFSWDNIGLGAASTRGFRFESTYLTTTGYRYLQTFEQLTPDSRTGFNSIWFTDYDLYGVDPVPEPVNLALAVFGVLAAGGVVLGRGRRRFAGGQAAPAAPR